MQLLTSYFNEDDDTPAEDVEIKFYADQAGEMRFYLTDAEKDRELVRTGKVLKGEQTIQVSMKLFDIYHIVLENDK